MSPVASTQRRGNLPAQGLFLGGLVLLAAIAVLATRSGQNAEFDMQLVAGFTAAFFATRLLTIRLPQGDDVYVTLVVGLSALAIADISVAIVASAVAALIEIVARLTQSTREASVARALDAVRGTAVIGLMAPMQAVLHPLAQNGGELGESVILWTLLAGALYAGLDLVSMAIQLRISGGLPITQGIATLQRPLGTMYLVHLAMAAVAIRLYGAPGVWAFPIALLLTLILQNSFNLYLRIRRGYAETIGALAHAAELDRPQDSGHARRVADLSVAVGRRMGLSSKDLERIGYAALLHDIGRMGAIGESASAAHVKRGAEIVASVPFLADVAPLIEHTDNPDSQEAPIGAVIVATCSSYDRLRADVGAHEALDALARDAGGPHERVLETLDELVRGHHLKAGVGS